MNQSIGGIITNGGDQCKRLGEQTLRGALRSILISGHQVHKFSQLMSANANQKGEN